MSQATAKQQSSEQATDKKAIPPFHVDVPEAELTELRRRINATRWPERETVTDATQGVQLATIQALASYWAKEYDWRHAPEGRALCGVGTAEVFFRRGSRGLQITAAGFFTNEEEMRHA